MQTSKPDELYEELAKRMQAEDGPGVRQVYRQLLDAGHPRQEIVSQISRRIEKPNPDKHIEPNETEAHRKPSAWSDTAIVSGADQRLDLGAKRTSPSTEILRTDLGTAQRAEAAYELGPEPQKATIAEHLEEPLVSHRIAGDRQDAVQGFKEHLGKSAGYMVPQQIGVSSGYIPERLASKSQPKRDFSVAESRQTPPAEAVPSTDRPSPAQHGSQRWSRAPGILLGTSIFAVAVAGLFVLWNLYGKDLQELSFVNAYSALPWLRSVRITNVSSIADAETPAETTGARQASAVHASDIAVSTSTAAATQNAVAGSAESRIEPNAPATQHLAGTAEQAVSSGRTLSRSQQNERDLGRHSETAASQLPRIDTGVLLGQGDQLLSTSDIASARIYYQRAAEAGDARGALRMGMTFDPVFLTRLRMPGVQADAAQATAWYRRAHALGNSEAELLEREIGSSSRGIGSGLGTMARVTEQYRHRPRVAARAQPTRYAPQRASGNSRRHG